MSKQVISKEIATVTVQLTAKNKRFLKKKYPNLKTQEAFEVFVTECIMEFKDPNEELEKRS